MKWLDWIEFALGIWTLAAPWVLGYWRVTSILWSSIFTGALIILLSLWRIVEVEDNNQPKQ